MAPLYAKLRADPYHSVLSDRETATLAWWTAALPHMEPRVATPKGDRTERIGYTDSAGKSQIIEAVVLGASSFKNTQNAPRFTIQTYGLAVGGKGLPPAPSTYTALRC